MILLLFIKPSIEKKGFTEKKNIKYELITRFFMETQKLTKCIDIRYSGNK